jgi:hypothetical protein
MLTTIVFQLTGREEGADDHYTLASFEFAEGEVIFRILPPLILLTCTDNNN